MKEIFGSTGEALYKGVGAEWIDNLAGVFGEPVLAFQLPGGDSRLAEVDEVGISEMALFRWRIQKGEYGIFISRSPNFKDDNFHVSLLSRRPTSSGIVENSSYHPNIAAIVINEAEKSVLFYTLSDYYTCFPTLTVSSPFSDNIAKQVEGF